MADDRTRSGTPKAELPELTGAVRPLRPDERPLAVELSSVVDEIRQLNTDFGIRPYQVFLVHAVWPGPRRGDGAAPQIISRREILPTPKLLDMSGVNEVLRFAGLTEEGTVRVREISTKYTEDDLMGRTPDLLDPALPRTGLRDAEFWWEVVERRPSTPTSVPRRFVPAAAPNISRSQFEWEVTLTKVAADRPRDGSTLPIARGLKQ